MTKKPTTKGDGLPDPEDVRESAEKAAPKVRLAAYWEAVSTLREKGFTWREAAEWLRERGVPVHYKQLERYAKKVEALGSTLEDEDNE